ncbi:TrmH family RNA methyltransferase [Ignatzschineria sp. LJL83]
MKINYSEITSAVNSKIKAIKKLEQKRQRDKEGRFVIEGFHLVIEAIQHHGEIEAILFADNCDKSALAGIEALLQQNADAFPNAIKMIMITESIVTTLSQTPAPQGIIAVLKQPKHSLETILQIAETASSKGSKESFHLENSDNRANLKRALPHLLLLDNVQDPGNVGTMIRTAEAAGFTAVILGEGSADLFNDKTIRATQGALFQLPILRGNLADILPELHAAGYESWVTTLEEATFYNELPKPQKCALIMGNEGQGVHPNIQKLATTKVKIPMLGQAESLNVGVAAGILIYDLMLK